MNEMTVFQNSEFGSVRTLEEDGKVLFCGNDVARALGYSNPRDALRAHCKGVVKRDAWVQTGTTAAGNPAMRQNKTNFIPESDVYRLAFQSKLPGAEKFTNWVTEEVLPSIRRTGGYAPDVTGLVVSTVQQAVAETLKAMVPLFLNPKMQKELTRQRTIRRCHSSIYEMDVQVRAELEELLLENRLTYQGISDYLRDTYGVITSKSSIGRYASRLYDSIEAEQEGRKTPRCPMDPT